MAQGKIQIKFEAKGDKALQLAIMNLDVATKRLTNQTSIYEKHLKNVGLTQKQANKFLAQSNRLSLLGVKNNRLLSNSLATLRSKLLIVSFGIGLVSMAFKKLFNAIIVQEQAEKKLEAALGEVNTALLNQASALQQVTTFGDEAIIEVQALIGAFVKDEEAIKAATKATLDLAAAKGMDLKSAGDLVSKTLGSSTNSLSRYGIEVIGVVGSTQRLESLTTNIATLFGGQAAAATDTLGGSVSQMTNAIGDTNEAIGKVLTPFVLKATKSIKGLAEAAGEFFLQMSENKLETAIRKLEELGEDADDLKKTLLTIEKIQLFEDLDLPLHNIKAVEDEIAKAQQQIIQGNKITAIAVRGQGEEAQKLLDKNIKIKDLQRAIALEVNEVMNSGNTINRNDASHERSLLAQHDIHVANEKFGRNQVANSTERLAVLLRILAIVAELNQLEGFGGDDKDLFGMTADQWGAMEENVSRWSGAIMNIANQYMALQQAQLNAGKQRELDAASNIKWEKKRTKEVEKINAKYQAKQDQLNRKAKKIKRVQTVVNTATGIMEAMASKELSAPAKIVMATLVGIMGAMQLATIDAQKYAQGGYVGGRRHSQGGTLIEAEQGEYVISRRGVEAAGIETLNRINAGGGSGSVNISFSGNVMSKDCIEDEAIPQIKEAIRRGADIGIG